MTSLEIALHRYEIDRGFWEEDSTDWAKSLTEKLPNIEGPLAAALKDRILSSSFSSLCLIVGDLLAEQPGPETEGAYDAYSAAIYEKKEPKLLAELGFSFLQRARLEDLPVSEADIDGTSIATPSGGWDYFQSDLIDLESPGPEASDKVILLHLSAKAFGASWLACSTTSDPGQLGFVRGLIALDGLRATFVSLGDADGIDAVCDAYHEWMRAWCDKYYDIFLDQDRYLSITFSEATAFSRGIRFVTRSRKDVSVAPSAVSSIPSLEAIQSTVTAIALRQLKQQQLFEERHPPSLREVKTELKEHLEGIWATLPSRVVDHLVRAERRFRMQAESDEAIISYCRAIEAALADCFVEPLLRDLERMGSRRLTVPFTGRPVEMSISRVAKFSLGEWAEILPNMSNFQDRSLASLAGNELRQGLKKLLAPEVLQEGVVNLALSLRSLQQLRAGNAHYQEPTTRLEQEELKLQQVREIVLGIGRKSILEEISSCFTSPV